MVFAPFLHEKSDSMDIHMPVLSLFFVGKINLQ